MNNSQNDIPPLFVELNMLYRNELNEYICWKEKARWIRFEEQAEDVLGRWSKPHVATIPHTSIDDLKELISTGTIILDVSASNFPEIIDIMANELLVYFKDLTHAKAFAELMCLPFLHHHVKKLRKNPSGNSLITRLNSSSNLDSNSNMQKKEAHFEHQNELGLSNGPHFLGNSLSINKTSLKYQYSFTDSIITEESSKNFDFKENIKFKKKVNKQSEGASILVMPVEFTRNSKLLFLRLETATEIQGLCEVKLKSKFLVLIIGPIDRKIQLYEIGRAISTCLADDVCREMFYLAKNKHDIVETLNQFNRNTMVIPPSEWNPKIRIEPPKNYLSKEERKNKELAEYLHDKDIIIESRKDSTLLTTLKPLNGILLDIKRKSYFFVSDFTDCFNLQALATTLYMYLVSLCTLVAFGGLFGQKTENLIAATECILAGSLCGILFSLFSGQPLNIISATGPVLILESIIKSLCDKYNLNFLELRLWIGLWTFIFLIILVIFNLSFLVKYITRFTEDCFATLVAIVFIIDAIKSVLKLKNPNKKNNNIQFGSLLLNNNTNKDIKNQLNEAKLQTNFYFSLLLFLTSYFLCTSLKSLKKKPFLPTKIRNFISDFSVMISIVVTSLIDYYIGLDTSKLIIPSKFQPTQYRNWIIPFFSNKTNLFIISISIIPALITTLLIFMDQQITAVIANRKELKLKKSHGYHLDLLVIAFCILFCSILGLPWFVAATVLTLTHINSLQIMSENTAPGEMPLFMGIREQRGTNFCMSVLIGLSVFLTKILSNIPMCALYGVFMFMGVSALNGIQFVQRVLILFMPNKYQPDLLYLRHVKTKRVHIYTIIQLLSTMALFLIKYIDSIAISFPILIVATCGIRKILDKIFTQKELFWLDDILPGKVKIEKVKQKNNGFLNDLIDQEKKENLEQKGISTLSLKNELVYQSTLSNSYFDLENENEQAVSFIDSNFQLNEKSKLNQMESNCRFESPVKFSTHFNNIKE